MSLIVDVLKIAQRDGVAKGSLPPFVKYPYEEGLRLRSFISKHPWLFRAAIGFSMLMILAVFVMMSQSRKANPKVDVPHKTIATITSPSQEYSVAPAEVELSENKPTRCRKKKPRLPPLQNTGRRNQGMSPVQAGKS